MQIIPQIILSVCSLAFIHSHLRHIREALCIIELLTRIRQLSSVPETDVLQVLSTSSNHPCLEPRVQLLHVKVIGVSDFHGSPDDINVCRVAGVNEVIVEDAEPELNGVEVPLSEVDDLLTGFAKAAGEQSFEVD